MHLLNVVQILSPLDVVCLTITSQEILKKETLEDCVPASFLQKKAEELIQVGEVPTRNITYWNISQGKEKSEIEDWNILLIKELTNSKMEVVVKELDNTKDVVEVSCEIYMIAHNCQQLTKELLKEVKCARVHTAFGQIDVEI